MTPYKMYQKLLKPFSNKTTRCIPCFLINKGRGYACLKCPFCKVLENTNSLHTKCKFLLIHKGHTEDKRDYLILLVKLFPSVLIGEENK